jgi:hypothetical protein
MMGGVGAKHDRAKLQLQLRKGLFLPSRVPCFQWTLVGIRKNSYDRLTMKVMVEVDVS